MDYITKYKTYDTFMFDVADDLSTYEDQGLINPDKYIKVVQKCNSTLSIKINPMKEDAIDIDSKGRGKLPDDFKLLNKAYICYEYTLNKPVIGTVIEYEEKIPVCPIEEVVCPDLVCNTPDYNCTPYQVWRKSKYETISISGIAPLYITSTSYCTTACPSCCPDNYYNKMYITEEDGCYFINTNFTDGVVYIEYVSEMIDDEGNLLILDHPLTNEYYEYEVKARIYEDLYLNGIDDVFNKLRFIEDRRRRARSTATQFVSTFDFAELKQVYFANRRRMASKYFNRIM